MALKILLADPDEKWLAEAKEFFKNQLYEVETVSIGREAQIKLYNEKFFAVILGYDIKNHPASQVIKFIKANHSDLRFIVMLEREHLAEEEDLLDKLSKDGVTEALVRPFTKEDLLEVLEGHQSIGDLMSSMPKREGQRPEEESSGEDEEFSRIHIDEFYSLKSVLFDVYIRLGESRFVKILHMGDEFSSDRLNKYKNEKGVEWLYFHKKDRKRYVKFNNYLASKMVENPKISTKSKVNLLKNISEKFLEESFEEGIKPVVMEQGKQICENVYKLVEKNDDLYKQLRNFQDFDPSAFSHAYLVTLFSASIIKQFEWESKTMIENTAMACLFHDIGKMNLPPDMATKRPEEMNEEELEQYHQHPEMGVEMLDDARLANQSIKQIILQHHEAFDGTGFPYGIKGSRILSLANIVACADHLSHIIVEQDKKPVEALKFMLSQQEQVKKFNSMIIEKLIQVFVEPGKITKEKSLPSNSKVVNSSKKAS